MTEITRFTYLLDDPEVRLVIFGLSHSGHALVPEHPGAARLRALVVRMLDAADAGQRSSWLSADVHKAPMTVTQVRTTLGDDVISEVGAYIRVESAHAAWQLAAVLPALMDAMSPSGALVTDAELAEQIRLATAEADRRTCAFAPHVF
ncbi:YidB family protein [Dactylosporangium sp. AC04546]|uniref:YidB family protein n=1 Tax=Dactylosporangium sp. AC04546 TaxID=2862460 RepID=UPI001EDF3482|nr:YidB family protein [Dactylosporangium sp. AC04546]WVK81125.1 YidB family protein [Dactylosporangium sp. AC04546]